MPTLVANIPASVREFYSKEIIRQAQPRVRFAQFAKKRTDLTTNAGSSIEFTKYSSITKGGKLTEGVSIDEKAMSNSRVAITVDEYGNAVIVSEKAIQLSMHNELQEASIALANDMAQVLDAELMGTALSTTNTVYGNGKATVGALVVGDAFTTKTIKDVTEKLGINNSPKFEGSYYVCIATPHQLRQLKDDSAWIDAHKYVESGVGNLYMGEVGMFDGVRFIETTNLPANDAIESQLKFGISIPTWEAVIFGENSYAWAEALPVEMRESEVKDYGRMHGIAWYAIWGFGLIEEKNIFSVITA